MKDSTSTLSYFTLFVYWNRNRNSIRNQAGRKAETRRNEDAALLSSYLLLFILLHSWTFFLGFSFHSKQRLSMHSLSYFFFFLSFSLLNWTDFCRSVCSWTSVSQARRLSQFFDSECGCGPKDDLSIQRKEKLSHVVRQILSSRTGV